MGSIQKILDSFNKINEDRKSQIKSKFEESSHWLENEFELIRKIIVKNSNPHENVSNLSSSQELNESNKRKSNEVENNNIRFSPLPKILKLEKSSNNEENTQSMINNEPLNKRDYKRDSIDVNTFDFNKLRKDQLLEELDKRGDQSFSMKHKKQDLIDGLIKVFMLFSCFSSLRESLILCILIDHFCVE